MLKKRGVVRCFERRLLLGLVVVSGVSCFVLTRCKPNGQTSVLPHLTQNVQLPLSHKTSALLLPPSYAHAFLDTSSMWAMGTNARTIPPRRNNVPLVTWTDGAVRRVQEAWTRVQDTAPCDRTMYAYTSYWGLTSQMRDYGDAALISLAFRRPLHYIYHARQPKWCHADAWLGCFFRGFKNGRLQHCYHTLAKKSKRADMTFRPNLSTPKLQRETHARFADSSPLVLEYLAELTFVLDNPMFFPTWLWDELIRDDLVRIVDGREKTVDPSWLKSRNPNLFHTLAVSALRTMLAPILFRPLEHIHRQAVIKKQHIGVRKQDKSPVPCVALHLRWTDKSSDGGVANVSAYSVHHVSPALELIRRKRGRASHRCIVLLTDDDINTVPSLLGELQRAKWPNGDLRVLSRVSDMFGPLDNYQMYAELGHRYVSDVMAERAPDKAFGYFAGLIVDVIVASQLSDTLIGVGSSGVSQLISQYMGAARKADANAFAIWQEDIRNESSTESNRL